MHGRIRNYTVPQISHNLFGPSAQIGQLFEIFLRRIFITCPLSMNKIIPVYIAFAGIKAASLGGGPSQLSGVPSFWV